MEKLKKNDVIRLAVTVVTSEGSGVGHANGMAVFVAGAAAGSTVLWMPWGMPRPRYAAGCAAGPATERFLVLEMAEYV